MSAFPNHSAPAAYDAARLAIDAVHAGDPVQDAEGRPAELAYADAVEAWVVRLIPDAPPLLRLAARCQHLERWSIPRSTYPEGRAGYLKWRQTLYGKQADLAAHLMQEAGITQAEAAEAAHWIAKKELTSNPGTQALEDAAVLVFLEREIGSFVAQHDDYPRSKFVGILSRTWKKLSPAGRTAALALPLAPAVREMIAEALASGA